MKINGKIKNMSGMPEKKNPSLKNLPSSSGKENALILVMERNMLVDDVSASPDFVKLRHPRRGVGAIFLFSPDNSIVEEAWSFSEQRSWFVNDFVRQNGEIFFLTPIDPLFLVLPYLKKFREERKTVPLEDLLIDDAFPDTWRLLTSSLLSNIHFLADKKGSEDLNAWLYNEEKTMKWLCKKTEKVAQTLMKKKINIGQNAASKQCVKSRRDNSCNIDSKLLLRYAHGLVSEYLTNDLSEKLLSKLGLPPEKSNKTCEVKRRLEEPITKPGKKFKPDNKIVIESKKIEKTKNSLPMEKTKNMKQTSGIKSITSYFAKKSKGDCL